MNESPLSEFIKAYDVRGLVPAQLNAPVARAIGAAFARVVALQKPTEQERGQWYFQRYVNHLPTSGEMVFYDRSWYNRAGVERVMGFCSPSDYLEFMRQCPEFERMLVRSGIRLYKYWFSVTREEQRARRDRGEHGSPPVRTNGDCGAGGHREPPRWRRGRHRTRTSHARNRDWCAPDRMPWWSAQTGH